jgi:hypothetical protein
MRKPQTPDTRRETGKKSDADTKKGKDTDQTNAGWAWYAVEKSALIRAGH